jgi:hypothetical protein
VTQPYHSRDYALCGLPLTVTATAPVLGALDARLKLLRRPVGSAAGLRFTFAPHAVCRPDGAVRPIYDAEAGEVVYDDVADRLYLALEDRVTALCDPVAGLTSVTVSNPTPRDLWLLSHPMLTLPLIESLKRRGFYSLHAAGLSRRGRGLLVVGSSGSGKTTLAIALARAGFDLLSDDMLFLSRSGDELTAHGFPDEVDITASTAEFFAELRPLIDVPRHTGWPKWSFRPEEVLSTSIAWTCTPSALVFPRIADIATSELEPLPAGDALMELLPNVLLTQPEASQAHLDMLAALTERVPSYRLWTARDFDRLPNVLGDLLP